MNDQDGTFSEIYSKNTGIYSDKDLKLLDYDNNGNLDLSLLGAGSNNDKHILFLNTSINSNTRPGTPENLSSEVFANQVKLMWNKAMDQETPQNGLSYNLYVRLGSDTIVSAHSLRNGKRKIPGIGNAQMRTFHNLKNLKDGIYHWSVQTSDNGFMSSTFAEESSFTIALEPEIVGMDSICTPGTANYMVTPSEYNYRWLVKGGTISGDSIGESVIINWPDQGAGNITVENQDYDVSDTLIVTKLKSPVAEFYIGENVGAGASVTFENRSSEDVIEWKWYLNTSELISEESNPIYEFTESGAYEISLHVKNSFGCENITSEIINVTDIIPIRIMTLITPNGDGSNDNLFIENIERYPANQVRVTNSWGNEVFYTEGYANDWNAVYNGNTLPNGNYIVMVRLTEFDKSFTETITILR